MLLKPVLFLFFGLIFALHCQADNSLALLTSRSIEIFLEVKDINEICNAVSALMKTIEADGSWADIKYNDTNPAVWAAVEHLTRTTLMEQAYLVKGPLYQDATLKDKTTDAINFWLIKDFKNPNWWYNEIGVPLDIAKISLLFKPFLSPTQIAKCSAIMDRANWDGWTGANAVWMATVHVYNGLLMVNESYVSEAYNKIYDTILIESGEADGIKIDGSFFQHGPQLYSGGYGSSFSSDILEAIYVSTGTEFEISQPKLAILERLVLDGQQWMIINRIWDINVIGRGISRPGPPAESFNTTLLRLVPGNRVKEWQAFASRLETGLPLLIGSKHYWKADYSVQRRNNYTVSVKMFSTRTFNSECVNDEGKESLHLADGANYIYRTGMEYNNISPEWDWYKIPGTSVEQGGHVLECTEVHAVGKTTFVGGVSDGTYGVVAYDYESPRVATVTAKKAWFLLESEFVALGTNITCKSSFPVATTLNQCLLNGSVFTTSSTAALPLGMHTLSNDWWVHHDSIGYIFPTQPTINLNNYPQKGSWSEVGVGSNATVSTDVFKLWIEHTSPVMSKDYYYIVTPSIDINQFKANAATIRDNIVVLSNSDNAQAVFHKAMNITGIVFWKPGKVIGHLPDWTISVDKPCAVLVAQNDKTIKFSVSNPQQDAINNDITLTISRKLTGGPCVANGDSTTLKFSLPADDMSGASQSEVCNIIA